jgi:Fe-S oxidoreductase
MPKKSCGLPMSCRSEEKKEPLDTQKITATAVSDYLGRCILCHRCMDVCPVTKGAFSIAELNQATRENQKVSSLIRQFIFHCVQCGKCVPVCPVNIRRDQMVRYIKFKLRGQKPWGYKRYLLVKGPNLPGLKGIIQKLFIAQKRISTRDLSCFMETTPTEESSVLFYPGCYIYSKKTVRQTLRLLDHIGCSYSVLGGVTACCGAPHLLQGEFEQSDYCLRLLYEKIKAVHPKIIITSCAECFEAVEQIKKLHNETFEVLSVVQYLMRNIDKFPSVKVRDKITIHDSCRFTKESAQGRAARRAATRFSEPIERKNTEESSCCFQWNHGNDPNNSPRRKKYLTEIKSYAPTLACTCLTCYEELKKTHTDVEIIDILQLFEESLDFIQSEEQKQ